MNLPKHINSHDIVYERQKGVRPLKSVGPGEWRTADGNYRLRYSALAGGWHLHAESCCTPPSAVALLLSAPAEEALGYLTRTLADAV